MNRWVVGAVLLCGVAVGASLNAGAAPPARGVDKTLDDCMATCDSENSTKAQNLNDEEFSSARQRDIDAASKQPCLDACAACCKKAKDEDNHGTIGHCCSDKCTGPCSGAANDARAAHDRRLAIIVGRRNALPDELLGCQRKCLGQFNARSAGQRAPAEGVTCICEKPGGQWYPRTVANPADCNKACFPDRSIGTKK